ncbi:B3 domain-containing transcription factor VRN1, partial [Mucuna pruriens]
MLKEEMRKGGEEGEEGVDLSVKQEFSQSFHLSIKGFLKNAVNLFLLLFWFPNHSHTMPRPCFHKLVLPTTLQSRQLRIPDNFLRKYGTQLSTIATLNVPDGSVWRIGLKKADNRICFVDGWQDFVQRYSIGVGYFLVFTYEGNSSFIVHIFNLSTSEVNYQSAMRNHNEGPCFANYHHIFDEMEDVDSLDLSDLSPPYLTPGPLQNKVFAGSVDQLTPGKSHTPALQNLFNGGSKLNHVNWGDSGSAFSSKGANSQGNQSTTRDIGVQFNAVEFKRSTDELKLRYSNEEAVNKTAKKKRKSDPRKFSHPRFCFCQEIEKMTFFFY